MNAKSRRKLEMGARALDFSRAHPDASPGYTAAMTRLEERVFAGALGHRMESSRPENLLIAHAAATQTFSPGDQIIQLAPDRLLL